MHKLLIPLLLLAGCKEKSKAMQPPYLSHEEITDMKIGRVSSGEDPDSVKNGIAYFSWGSAPDSITFYPSKTF